MDFFHFATTNARYEFQPLKDAEDRRERVRVRNDEIVKRYLRRIGTDADPFKVTPVGWGRGRLEIGIKN